MQSLFQYIFEPLLSVGPVNFTLRLNEAVVALASLKSIISPSSFTAGTSLQYWHKIPDVFE